MFSVVTQGSLIPKAAKVLNLINETGDGEAVLKIFTDCTEEVSADLLEYTVKSNDTWVDKTLIDMDIPADILIVMIKRKGKIIIPRGFTTIHEEDVLVLTGDNVEKYINYNNPKDV